MRVNTVIKADALKKLKTFDDNSFDHCITDPPYKLSDYDNKKQIGWYKSNKTWSEEKSFKKLDEVWDTFSDDEYMDFTVEWLKEVFRVVKPNGNILVFGTYHNIYDLGFLFKAFDKKIINSIIWYKRNAFPNITQRMFCESTEQIIWAVNNPRKKASNWTFNYKKMKDLTENKKQMRNMWDIPMTKNSEKSFGKHPTQKPIEVGDRLVLGCTNKNDIILDPFSGSGTFLVSAKKHSRKYIGIETEEMYVELSRKRLKSTKVV